MQLPKCDKCGGLEFELEPEEVEYVPASQYYAHDWYGDTTTTGTYWERNAICKGCGAKYSRGQYTPANVGSLDKAC